MADTNRSYIAGQTYFTYIRGKTCDSSFFDDACFGYYLVRLLNSLNNFQVKLHAYCLLPREILLLASPGSPGGLPNLLRYLNRSYSEYFNLRFDRSIEVWPAQYNSSLVQGEQLTLDCQKFIEREALNAKGLIHPGAYRWSSYCSNSFGCKSEFIFPNSAYLNFLSGKHSPYKDYREFIATDFAKGYELYLVSKLKYGKNPAKRQLSLCSPIAKKRRWRSGELESRGHRLSSGDIRPSPQSGLLVVN